MGGSVIPGDQRLVEVSLEHRCVMPGLVEAAEEESGPYEQREVVNFRRDTLVEGLTR